MEKILPKIACRKLCINLFVKTYENFLAKIDLKFNIVFPKKIVENSKIIKTIIATEIIKKAETPTAVWRDCEFYSKIKFIFRKKFYISRNISVTKFATTPSGKTLALTAQELLRS